MTSSTTSTHFPLELLDSFHPRKLLYHPAQEHNFFIINYFHANAATVLLVLSCAIVSSFGLLCMAKCSFRGSSSVAAESDSFRGSSSVAAESGENRSTKSAHVGVKQKALNAFPIVKYATELKLPSLDTTCAICLSEFAAGEILRILPKCNHGFHILCIDTWLSSHSSCPTCRHSLVETDQKANNCSQEVPVPMQETMNIEVN
ncbi:RING-H2 finger protein ATL78-like [Gossypium raimondii]|uniref:RING-H2 finger protein ATL78-like n=1 Tax=Gossypium raimondii TaxID=29730 RepID=UPI00063AA912|nr:RING-H2 finger protein ATL78-like [Gossypium raimondii]